MSITLQNRQPKGSKVAGVSAGGQFAGTQRTEAAPDSLGAQPSGREEAARKLAATLERQKAIAGEVTVLKVAEVAHRIREVHPDAKRMIVGHFDHEDTVRFGRIEGEGGKRLAIDTDLGDEIDDAVEQAAIPVAHLRRHKPADGDEMFFAYTANIDIDHVISAAEKI